MSLKLTSYKGTRDLYPDDMLLRNYVFSKWRNIVSGFGYREYAAPLLEPLELYAAKSGEEIVNDQTYSFFDRGNRQMVIRPEMTPSIARMVAARRQELAYPARLFSIANFMRYERPQHGREREFWQLNFDLFGDAGAAADFEIIDLSHSIMSGFGASDDMYTIKVNDRRLTDLIMRNYLSLNDEQAHDLIKLLDRVDKISPEAFDEQAIAIVGDEKLTNLKRIISARHIDDLPKEISNSDIAISLNNLLSTLNNSGISNVQYDVKLMRGFDYYTGVVFEVFDESPDNKRAIFGGGRYDKLINLFGVEQLPVVGAAPGETMFIEFLRVHNLLPDLDELRIKSVDILLMIDDARAQSYAREVAQKMRSLGYAVAVDGTSRKIDKKVKSAVKRQSTAVIFVGDEEIEQRMITIRVLETGTQISLSIGDLADIEL